MKQLTGIYRIGRISTYGTRICFDLQDKLPSQVASYVKQIFAQSEQLKSTPIKEVVILSNNKLTIPTKRLTQLKAKTLA